MNLDQLRSLVEEVQCPLCLDLYKVPRVLSCQHSFCTPCIQQLVYSTKNDQVIQCPICRRETLLSKFDNQIEKLSINLPLSNIVTHFQTSDIQHLLHSDIPEFSHSLFVHRFPPVGPGMDLSFLELYPFKDMYNPPVFISQLVNITSILIDHSSALRIFRKWIEDLWFAPASLASNLKTHGPSFLSIRYIPFYMLSFTVKSNYIATVLDSEPIVRHTPSSRILQNTISTTLKNTHTGVQTHLICASDNLSICKLASEITLDGREHESFVTSHTPVVPDEALPWFVAWRNHDMGINIRRMAQSSVRECLHEELQFSTIQSIKIAYKFSNVSYKLLYFPFYISSYEHNSVRYDFVISAETGEISGNRPYGTGSLGGAVSKVRNWFAL